MCRRQLWLDEQGTSGDLAELSVRCECGKRRLLYEATELDRRPLGTCRGSRPWLGRHTEEPCDQPSRLLIRTASNAYFPQVVSVLSLPDRGNAIDTVVTDHWDDLGIVETLSDLAFMKRKPPVAAALDRFTDEGILEAIARIRGGGVGDRPVKSVELDALLMAEEGFGDDIPIDPNFHARWLPESVWRKTSLSDGMAAVVQLHRLREVLALIGFTRFEAAMRDIHGEYDTDVERAQIAIEPTWFPAVENRGEGIFVQLRSESVDEWLERDAVRSRVLELQQGYIVWAESRKSVPPFPGGAYVLLHTLSHLLIQSLAMRCGYPSTRVRRTRKARWAGSCSRGGTWRTIWTRLRMGELCSNDPICARQAPAESVRSAHLHGAACHGCTLIAETSCEMRNDYLDRALVVPILG